MVSRESGGYLDILTLLAVNLDLLAEFHKTKGSGVGSNKRVAARGQMSSNTPGRARKGGNITVKTLAKLARIYGVTPAQLFCPINDPTNLPEIVYDQAEKDMLRLFRQARGQR